MFFVAIFAEGAYGWNLYPVRSLAFLPHFDDRPLFAPSIWVALRRQGFENGGVPLGGVMPAFGSVLDEDEALDVIAHIQSLWTDEIYTRWQSIENR